VGAKIIIMAVKPGHGLECHRVTVATMLAYSYLPASSVIAVVAASAAASKYAVAH